MSSATAIRVSLGSTLRLLELSDAPAALPPLDRAGPLACLDATAGEHGPSAPVQPTASALFGPRGACLLGNEGPLWVCDTGHHRLLGWAARPAHDPQAADRLIGQPAFDREGADSGHNRVLLWRLAAGLAS